MILPPRPVYITANARRSLVYPSPGPGLPEVAYDVVWDGTGAGTVWPKDLPTAWRTASSLPKAPTHGGSLDADDRAEWYRPSRARALNRRRHIVRQRANPVNEAA